jgi:hypothetical protein
LAINKHLSNEAVFMMDLRLKRIVFCGFLVFTGSGGVTGCSLFQDIWEQDTIAEYGESVFRRQNLISSQVMMLSETDLSAENTQKLQQAESQMQKDCRLLNEYASREMDKESIDLLFQKQVRDSIKSCDLSIQNVEALLVQLGIKE